MASISENIYSPSLALNLTFWVSTILVSAMMLASGCLYLMQSEFAVEGMAHLGYPSYFLWILGVPKVLGSLTLLFVSNRILREWAYAGFFFTCVSAALSHNFSGDGLDKVTGPAVALALLSLSYWAWNRFQSEGYSSPSSFNKSSNKLAAT